MALPIDAAKLARSIRRLHDERRALTARLAELEAIFEQAGIDPMPQGSSRPASKPPAKPATRRKAYAQTASEFILGLVKGKKLMTAEINVAWKKAGRSGLANVTLGDLVKSKKLKRRKVRGGRGSRYGV